MEITLHVGQSRRSIRVTLKASTSAQVSAGAIVSPHSKAPLDGRRQTQGHGESPDFVGGTPPRCWDTNLSSLNGAKREMVAFGSVPSPLSPGMDLYFVGTEADTVWGPLFTKENTVLQEQS